MAHTAAAVAVSDNAQAVRAESAKRVRALMTEWSSNTLRIGLELQVAHDTFPVDGAPGAPRPGWNRWLRAEIGIGEKHALSLIAVARKFGHLKDKPLPSNRVLTFLARSTTPDAGVREVLRRVAHGEKVGRGKAEQIAQKHRPKPKEANKQAKETGKPVLASDGFLYFGASKEKAKESEERRTIVYSVRRAVECLALVKLTPHQFLSFALPHQLWTSEDEKQIGTAVKWLNALHSAWEMRR